MSQPACMPQSIHHWTISAVMVGEPDQQVHHRLLAAAVEIEVTRGFSTG